MTANEPAQPAPLNHPAGIDLLVLPGMHLLDLAGPAQVFAHRSVGWPLRVIGPATHTSTAQGVAFNAIEPLPHTVEQGRWLIAIGSTNMAAVLDSHIGRRTIAWLKKNANAWERVGAVCSGTLLLGDAGLLDGYRSTTHHSLLSELHRRAPNTTVEDDTLFVDDRDRCTSAGLSSAIDLALHLVQSHLGAAVADGIARDLMIYRRAQFTSQPLPALRRCRHHPDQRVHAVQDHMDQDPRVQDGLADLAGRVHLSERQLRRRFLAATGCTLRGYLQRVRLAKSATLLQQTNWPIEHVAEASGFGDTRAMQRLWQRHYGTSPRQVRDATRPTHRCSTTAPVGGASRDA